MTSIEATGRREQTKAQNREAIVAAARTVFAELGFETATVRDIIRSTGLASGTFYNYFEDKNEVFLAILWDTMVTMRERVRVARRSATSLETFVDGAYRAFFSTMAQDPVTFGILRRNAEVVRHYVDHDALRVAFTELREDIVAATDAGVLPRLDADELTAVMGGVAFELCIRMLDRDPPDVEETTTFATEFVLGGIDRLSDRGGRRLSVARFVRAWAGSPPEPPSRRSSR